MKYKTQLATGGDLWPTVVLMAIQLANYVYQLQWK